MNKLLHGIGDRAEEITGVVDGKFDVDDKELAAIIKAADKIIATARQYALENR